MIICVNCKKEMEVRKNGYGIRYGPSHVYPGDLYECGLCRYQVILIISKSVFDPERIVETLLMI